MRTTTGRATTAFLSVLFLTGLAFIGVEILGLRFVFGILIPYAAFIVFVTGFIWKIVSWAKSPVPFNITTTAGQQKSLKFIKSSNLENPSGTGGVIGRMFLEVFFFRSLFRNTKVGMTKDNRPGYESEKTLWLGGLLFHWSFLYVYIRHLRFFTHPVPGFVSTMESFDTIFQIGLPALYVTDIILLLAVTFLILRRVTIHQVKYFSLIADYFPLLMILAITVSGIAMRYFTRIDIMDVKTLAIGLISFKPSIPASINSLFYVHLFLVSAFFMYFPFSKLMHMGGIFLSPTRNLTGNSRKKRHVNPWNYPVKTHSYAEYEDDFREMMKGAGLPVEKDSPPDKNERGQNETGSRGGKE